MIWERLEDESVTWLQQKQRVDVTVPKDLLAPARQLNRFQSAYWNPDRSACNLPSDILDKNHFLWSRNRQPLSKLKSLRNSHRYRFNYFFLFLFNSRGVEMYILAAGCWMHCAGENLWRKKYKILVALFSLKFLLLLFFDWVLVNRREGSNNMSTRPITTHRQTDTHTHTHTHLP